MIENKLHYFGPVALSALMFFWGVTAWRSEIVTPAGPFANYDVDANFVPIETEKKDFSVHRSVRPEIYYKAVVERPIFSVERRPFESSDVVSQAIQPEAMSEREILPTSPPLPEVILLGALIADVSRSALVSVAGSDPEWLHENDAVSDGWRIVSVHSRWIEIDNLLDDNNDSVKIDLYK